MTTQELDDEGVEVEVPAGAAVRGDGAVRLGRTVFVELIQLLSYRPASARKATPCRTRSGTFSEPLRCNSFKGSGPSG